MTLVYILSPLIVYIIVVAVYLILQKEILKNPENPLPTEIPNISNNEIEVINLYMKEWETIIKTQMHFNDLVIRFRSIILTSFATLIGAVIVIFQLKPLHGSEYFVHILVAIGIFWSLAFVLDLFYYHRLLLGSVSQAQKFDQSDLFKEYGFFGMTSCITKHISPFWSNMFIFLFYTLPMLIFFILYILFYT